MCLVLIIDLAPIIGPMQHAGYFLSPCERQSNGPGISLQAQFGNKFDTALSLQNQLKRGQERRFRL